MSDANFQRMGLLDEGIDYIRAADRFTAQSYFPSQKGTHAANLMLASSNRREASSVGGPSD